MTAKIFSSTTKSGKPVEAEESKINLLSLKPKPFVKWAGGKRGVIKKLLSRLPKELINNYYEPFIGGGALFFELYDKVGFSYLSDLNADLVIAYNVIKKGPEDLIKLLKEHEHKHNKDYYYKVRDEYKRKYGRLSGDVHHNQVENKYTDLELEDFYNQVNSTNFYVESTAMFIYLLKTCFNGLYRVNCKGEFNTPIGNYKNPNIADGNNLLLVNKALQRASIMCQDFTRLSRSKRSRDQTNPFRNNNFTSPKEGDFVYFDPPYHPIDESSFVKYVSNGFSKEDQIRLRNLALELNKKNVNVMLSNSDTKFIHEIYGKDFKIERIKAPRVISCKSNGRQAISEVVITNY